LERWCSLPSRRLELSAGRMCGGRNLEAGIAAVVGGEGSFGPVEGRPAVEEVDSTERSLADRVELRKVGAQIAAGLHNCIRQAHIKE
jgi:hypothetical protein